MFDSNRAALGSLYQETSYLTFEGTKLQGVAQIVQKLTSLPFQARALVGEELHARAWWVRETGEESQRWAGVQARGLF